MTILTADAGGTRTRLALHDTSGKTDRRSLEPICVDVLPSASAPTLEEIVRNFLARHPVADRLEAACIGVPGPVLAGSVRATNLPKS